MIDCRVSIITPMYNGALFVADTIESVIGQSFSNWEMIIVDDCSPDNGAGIRVVESYCARDERIHLIVSKLHLGSSGARNIALNRARGRYISFLDSDDIWHPDFLEKQMAFLKANDAPIVFSSYRRVDETTGREILSPFIVPSEVTYRRLLYGDPIFPSTAIYDRQKTGPRSFKEEMGSLRDDYVFWLDIMKWGFKAYGNKEILADYRIRKSGVTVNKLKVMGPQWKVYREQLGFNFMRSLWYFSCWAFTSLKKYLK